VLMILLLSGEGSVGIAPCLPHVLFQLAVCSTFAVDVVAVVDNEAWSFIQLAVGGGPVVATVVVVVVEGVGGGCGNSASATGAAGRVGGGWCGGRDEEKMLKLDK